jgi:hypothetical protein
MQFFVETPARQENRWFPGQKKVKKAQKGRKNGQKSALLRT